MADNHTMRTVYISLLSLVFLGSVVFIYLSSFQQLTGVQKMASKTKTSNVIVVGGGLAGLCATVEAASHGAKVTLIDKEKNTGGNSAKATSGMNGAGTEAQKAKGVKDDISSLVKDTLASGDKLSVPELVEVLARNSVLAHEWLLTTFGLNLSNVVQLGGHSKARTHRFPPTPEGKPVPVGWTLVSTLRKYIDSNLKDDVTIITNAVFKDVIMKDGVVTGLHYTDINNEVKTLEGVVILTAGGYANDHTNTSLLEKFVPDLAKLPTTNGPWATGDIIKSTSKIGIKYTLMNYVQVHPTGFLEPSNPKHHTKFLAPEALRGCGAILLDSTGNRFVNELGRRDHVSEQIFNSCGPFQGVDDNPKSAIMLLSNQVIEKFGAPSAGFYKFKQLIQDVGSLAQLAEKVNIDVEALKQTLSKYRSAAKEGKDQFGKTVFPVVFSDDDHFLVAFITPTLHYCMGGIAINPKAQVLKDLGDDSSMDSVIEGLYAAGEVSGGVHGKNRLGGNSLLECVVFGRVAGQQAAHFTSKV